MAELEVANHAKQALKIVTDQQHPFWHKLRELLFEVSIIIFAVSISIWMHGIGEHHHEQEQVKTFLLGLKRDLQGDLNTINNVVKFHKEMDVSFIYLRSLNPADPIDAEKFDAAYVKILSSTMFRPEVSRYEGFKSSGKLINIDNDDLVEKILSYYHTSWPIPQEQYWLSRRNKMISYIESIEEKGEDRAEQYKLITSAKGKYLLKSMPTNNELYGVYSDFAGMGKEIIQQIDQMYPEAAK